MEDDSRKRNKTFEMVDVAISTMRSAFKSFVIFFKAHLKIMILAEEKRWQFHTFA